VTNNQSFQNLQFLSKPAGEEDSRGQGFKGSGFRGSRVHRDSFARAPVDKEHWSFAACRRRH